MKNEYRIVEDGLGWPKPEVRYWFFPFLWFRFEVGSMNSSSIESAKEMIDVHSAPRKVLCYLGRKP